MKPLQISTFTSHREKTIGALRFFSKKVNSSYLLPKLSRLINKYFYRLGLGSAINRYDNSFTIYSAKSDKSLYKDYSKNDIFINFGSGAFFHNRWKNYDYPGQSLYYKSLLGLEGKDFRAIDLCKANLTIPEKSDSVQLIYCSHTLEHIDLESSKRFLSECYRILKKDGVLRVVLPNTKNDFYLLRCIMSQSNKNFALIQDYIDSVVRHIITDTKFLETSEIDEILKIANYDSENFYDEVIKRYRSFSEFKGTDPGRHINYWDFNNLMNVTSKLGFSFCIPFYQGTSIASPFKNLNVFDNTESHIAIYADIIK